MSAPASNSTFTSGKINSPNDWSFDYRLYDNAQDYDDAKGGLVLSNLFHDGFSFARDLRVIGIWFFPKDKTNKPEFLILGMPDFEVVSFTQYNKNLGQSVERAPHHLRSYNTYLQMEVEYKSTQGLFGKNAPVKIIQKYLFTDYSDSPAHEPAGAALGFVYGALIATRLFPMITLQLTPEYSGVIESFRVDYYIHPKIDGFADRAKNLREASEDYPNGLADFPNQAGVFLDGINPLKDGVVVGFEYLKDAYFLPFPFNLHPLFAPLIEHQDPDFVRGVFESVEKPLLLEICTTGIKDSKIYFPGLVPGKDYGWDNIHWWGSRGKGNPIISAIGAFHCFHLHWRWGYGGQWAPAGEQFEGNHWFASGPLVDPNLPIQTVRFAITRYDKRKDPELVSLTILSQENFSDLFHSKNLPQPADINSNEKGDFEGDNIVLWYSVESKIPEGFSEGTVFIHGIFFAHENEPLYNPLTGSTTEEYWPDSPKEIMLKRQWNR